MFRREIESVLMILLRVFMSGESGDSRMPPFVRTCLLPNQPADRGDFERAAGWCSAGKPGSWRMDRKRTPPAKNRRQKAGTETDSADTRPVDALEADPSG